MRRFTISLLVLIALFVAWPDGARADPPGGANDEPVEGPADEGQAASAVDQLRPEELELLRRKLPGWDTWEAARREHVAARVLRLRRLSPEQRDDLSERARRWRERREGEPPQRGRRQGDPSAHAALVGSLLGDRIVEDLPQDVAARLARSDLRGGALGRHLVRMLWPRLAEFEGRRLLAGGVADLPPAFVATDEGRRLVAEMEAVQALDPQSPEARGARVRLGQRAIGLELGRLRSRVAGVSPREVREKIGQALWERWQPVREAAWLELRAGGGEALVDAFRRRESVDHIITLERLMSGALAGDEHAEARGWADRLVRHLLVHNLGATPADVEALPAPGDPARTAAVRTLVGVGREGGPGRERGPGGRRARR